jgi:hypothetical protein
MIENKMKQIKFVRIVLFITFLFLFSNIYAQEISLAGDWSFEMDRQDAGITQKWFNRKLNDKIHLPGSMNENGKGDNVGLNTKWTGSIYDSSFFFQPRLAKYRQPGNVKIPFWLTPLKHYVGVAWYQKEIVIPANWNSKRISLFLERTHILTRVWIDDKEVDSSQNSLSVPHEYDLTKFSSAGKHTITIRIDNRIKDVNVGPDSHSVSDHTQSNWNGIVGKISLKAESLVAIKNVQVFPDIEKKTANVKIFLSNYSSKVFQGKIILSARSFNSPTGHIINPQTISFSINAGGMKNIDATISFGDKMLTWDEFDPSLYQLKIVMGSEVKEIIFGMREVKVKGKQILVNGCPVFLRGDVNCCEFPLTGYPAMDLASWEKIFRKLKSYGINHIRFHSWCPPEAAFNAADKIGLYLQPEAPTWPNHGTSLGDGRFIDQYIYDETNRMAKAYGNHPSFMMLAAGNEPAGRNQAKYLADFIQYWKAKDNRRIYTGASVAMSWPLVPENEYMIKSGARNLNWNNSLPESVSDYRKAVENFSVPYVTHEQGQWCVFPDFKEIHKYKGAFRARNFELFKEDFHDQGMDDEAEKFLMASGKLQVLCYKNEIEKSLRTQGLSGFQLLGLEDFSGQGTALVGVLNAFYEEKGYINSKEFSRFCNATVPLIRTSKFVYKNNESFDADVELFNFGKAELKNQIVSWEIKNEKGKLLERKSFPATNYPIGNCLPVGKIHFPLSNIKQAAKFTVEVKLNGTPYANDWNIWVYPSSTLISKANEIYYTDTLDENARKILEQSGKVFLQAAGKVVKGKEVVQYFTPVFWNTSWFKMRPPHTLGILVDSSHPVFRNFPTGYYSDLQLWEIVNKAQVMHLEYFPKAFRPLIQPIDTWFMNRRLTMLFEVKVGKGKLMVCSADLQSDLENRPAAKQLLYSIQQYMLSSEFNPTTQVDISVVEDLFLKPSKYVFDAFTKDSPDELKPKKN